MKDLIKLNSMALIRKIIFKLQLFIRFLLNGKCYPTEEQRENGGFRDYWIGWIAYKYFSKTTVNGGWLTIEFVGPDNDLVFIQNSHGDKMTNTFQETLKSVKRNNGL
jgi:hypothetical protein